MRLPSATTRRPMNRRHFLHVSGVATAGLALAPTSRVLAAIDAEGWRTCEVTSTVEVTQPAARHRLRPPRPLRVETSCQKSLGSTFHAEGGQAREEKDATTATAILTAEWAQGVRPVLTLTSRVRTRDRA